VGGRVLSCDFSISYHSISHVFGGLSFPLLILHTLFFFSRVGIARYMLACLPARIGGIWGVWRLLWLFDAYDAVVVLCGHGRIGRGGIGVL